MNNYKVAVLMASHNGLSWLPEQLSTVLNQTGVDVGLYISDDSSQDGTYAYLNKVASQESRIRVLPVRQKIGGAGKNFYRLIQEVDFSEYDFIAFADQDDIWKLDKLSNHIKLMTIHHADGVSSNVLAFWPDGKRKLIIKSQPQREFDYLFESASAGCTFLITPWLVNVLKSLLNHSSIAMEIALHDWLAYAVCRASGRKWYIDSIASVDYRQHGRNVIGANHGLQAKIARLSRLKDGWYRGEILKICKICTRFSTQPVYSSLISLLQKRNLVSRLRLLAYIPQARRKWRDRLLLSIAVLLGYF